MTTYAAGFHAFPSAGHLGDHALWETRFNIVDQNLGIEQALNVKSASTSAPKVIDIYHVGRQFDYHRTYFDVFYNQIHLIPREVELGAVSSDGTASFLIWNSYLFSIDFTSVTGFQVGQGVSLASPVLPMSLGALALQEVVLDVTATGTPTIDSTLILNFSTAVRNLRVFGDRSKLFPFLHNWSKGAYSVELEYKTEVWTSRSGKEQRRGYRQTPRKRIDGDFTMGFANFRLFNRLMDSWQKNQFAIPELSRKAYLAVRHQASTNDVTLEGVAPDWIVPGSSVIFRLKGEMEIRRVNSVSGSTVNFSNTSLRDWESGTLIHPLLSAYVGTNTSAQVHTDSVETLQVSFDVIPGTEPSVAIPAATTFFKGYELFQRTPNWKTSPKLTFTVAPEDVDFGFGRIARFNPIEFGSRMLQLGYTNANENISWEIINLFRRMSGQLGEFYMPTWSADILPEFTSPTGTRLLRFAGDWMSKEYGDSTIYKAISIRFGDGTVQNVGIQSIVEQNDLGQVFSVMTLEDDLVSPVSPSSVTHISWLLRWRFASDQLSIEWITDDKSQISVTMKTLEALA